MQARWPTPPTRDTFERCKLDFTERQSMRNVRAAPRPAEAAPRGPLFRAQKPRGVDGAVLAPEAFVLRFFGDGGDDRLLLVNLGRDLHLDPARSRCWRRRRTRSGTFCGPASIRATAATARPRWTRKRTGVCPDTRPSPWLRPARKARASDGRR